MRRIRRRAAARRGRGELGARPSVYLVDDGPDASPDAILAAV